MIGAGMSIVVIVPVWLKSLNGSSLDWTGNPVIQYWFRQYGAVFLIYTSAAAAIAGLTLIAVGIGTLRAPKRRAGPPSA